MYYGIVFARSAERDYRKLKQSERAAVRDALNAYLTDAPKKSRKTRIKRLTGLKQPQFRLRVGDVRIYYDVNDQEKRVEILGIVSKSRSERWLKKKGISR